MTNSLKQEMAEFINGTCNDVDQVLRVFGKTATDRQRDELNDYLQHDACIQECVQCGWWTDDYDLDESTGEAICDQCLEERTN